MNFALRPSNMPWADSLPIEWGEACLRWYALLYAGGTPSKAIESYWENGTIPWLNSGSVNDEVITEPSAFITEEAFNNSSAKWIPKGSLLMALAGQGKTKGMVAQLGFDATCNQSMAAILPNKKLEPRFLYYWLKTNYQNIRNMGGGDLRDGLNLEMLATIKLPLPPLDTQKSIVEYLDDESSRVSSLIYEKQTFITLLKEKRQALISYHVTKGLDPNVKMKDSGVEWIGEVPEHWEVARIKQVVSTPVTDGPHETPEFLDSGIPFISAEAVSSGYINFDKKRGYISSALNELYSKKYTPKLHDIYMIKSGATTGVTAIVETEEVFNIWSPLAVVRCDELMEPYYVLNFMRSFNFLEAVELNWSFGTQQNIGMKVIENLHIAMPPKYEQLEIANHLKEKVDIIDKTVAETHTSIELLKEHRTALISAAVTGKIDVRDMAIKNKDAS